ncbi:hypothetical protein OAT31_02410 [Candidatus Marinimicrobia bacterium]|nr:hypothetical protein [Candidatus Neomarinimicrobiota bacterium]
MENNIVEGKYNVIWVDDQLEDIVERHSIYKEHLNQNINMCFFRYFDDARNFYDENFKNIYGIILDYKTLENERDTKEKGRVGATMLRTFLEKCHNNDQMIPICYATAVPEDISRDNIDDYKEQYAHESIEVFDKFPNAKEMFAWISKMVIKVDSLSNDPHVTILEKYLLEGSKNSRKSFSNMKKRISSQDRINGSDFTAFGKYIERLMKQMPLYTNIPSEIRGKQWDQMTLDKQIKFISNTQDFSKEKVKVVSGKYETLKHPFTDQYLNCDKYKLSFNPIIHQFLDLIRLVKNKVGSHETTTNDPYLYSTKQYKVVFNAFKETLLWFDHIYKDKFTQKYGS